MTPRKKGTGSQDGASLKYWPQPALDSLVLVLYPAQPLAALGTMRGRGVMASMEVFP